MRTQLIAVCIGLLAACFGPSTAIGAPSPAATASTPISPTPAKAEVGLAYDDIAKVIISGTPPPPDNFVSDANLIAKRPPMHTPAAPSATAGMATGLLGGLLGSIPGVGPLLAMGASAAASAAANAAQKRAQAAVTEEGNAWMRIGRISQLAYYHGWRRVATGQYVAITKPDQGLTMALDYAKRTYTSQRVDPDIPTYTVDATPAPIPAIIGSPTVVTLSPTTIEHRRVRGYRLSGTLETAQAVGWCQPGRHDIEIVEYVSDLRDPDNQLAKAPDSSTALASVCQPSTSASSFEPGKLVLYRSLAIRPSIAGDLIIAFELGNIRTLDERDNALFSPPSDFTEEH